MCRSVLHFVRKEKWVNESFDLSYEMCELMCKINDKFDVLCVYEQIQIINENFPPKMFFIQACKIFYSLGG